ncbi:MULTISPECIES: hypothetical protein [Exiguobacterium]|uniref:hypothetical protein n=2 Tax=Bacillales Family XII. Incertae Sedis TaxID=539742 RepID=UPI000450DB99|nr:MULTISPECIES: hypothetical protein [Exiguobacterium]EZP58385.1 hypothetical protein BW42_03067 [Exiguobacterium sp. RIT341]UKS57895.1 hypothetical protein K6T22_16805 [Exiguobacterium acetylicum]
MDSSSSVQHRQLVVSQAAKTLLENDVTEQLASIDIVDVEAYVNQLYEECYEFQNEEDVYTKLRYYSFKKLKRRWVRSAIRNYVENKGPMKELRGLHKMYLEFWDISGKEGFQRKFSADSVEDLMKEHIRELEEWAENNNLLIHTYPHWGQKTKNQRTSTMRTDVLMVIGEVAKGLKRVQPKAHVATSTSITVPFFGLADRMKNTTEKFNQGEGTLMDLSLDLHDYSAVVPKYKQGVPNNLSVLVSNEFLAELDGKVPDLDSRDFEAFNEILSYRDISFQTNRKIVFPISKLVKKIYGNDSGKSYALTTQRLVKLGYYRVAVRNEEGDLSIFGLFSSVKISGASAIQRDTQITVTVSEEVYDDLLKQQIISIYGEQIERLKGTFAYHLSFVLQKERLSSFQLKEEMPAKRHWRQFTHSIRFNKSRKAENLKELETNLDRIKELDFIIQDWHRSGDYYFLYFHPLERWELDDRSNVLLL